MRRVVLAEYFLTEERALLFVLRDDLARPEVIQLDTDRVTIRDVVARHASDTLSGLVDRVEPDEWRAVTAPLIEPLHAWLEPDDLLWIVPHDALHYFPLHAAPLEDGWLTDRYAICYTPTASVMRHCRRRRTGRHETGVVVGDPRRDLLHAREEAAAVASVLNTTPVMGEDATKEHVQRRLADAAPVDIVHLACHGYFDPADPLASGLLLAAGDGDDGRLTAAEIVNLPLRTDLVVISACESGVSEQRGGDELIGLTRSLLHAGAASAVLGLWRVDDQATSLVMREFYRRLGDTDHPVAKVDALRIAQRAVRDLSAAELVADCEQRLAEADDGSRRVLALDRANAQAAAGDLAPALETYERLLPDTSEEDAHMRRVIESGIGLLRFRSRYAQPVDYDVRPFAAPRAWAGLSLFGSWS